VDEPISVPPPRARHKAPTLSASLRPRQLRPRPHRRPTPQRGDALSTFSESARRAMSASRFRVLEEYLAGGCPIERHAVPPTAAAVRESTSTHPRPDSGSIGNLFRQSTPQRRPQNATRDKIRSVGPSRARSFEGSSGAASEATDPVSPHARTLSQSRQPSSHKDADPFEGCRQMRAMAATSAAVIRRGLGATQTRPHRRLPRRQAAHPRAKCCRRF